MQSGPGLFQNKNVVAWVLMITALAVHVFDESVTGFLPFYNELVLGTREKLGFFPVPTFSFDIWLGGLVVFVAACFSITPIIHQGGRLIRVVATALGVIMTLNAGAHMVGSLYMGRLLPGFWSSPVLLIAAVWIVTRGLHGQLWARTSGTGPGGK